MCSGVDDRNDEELMNRYNFIGLVERYEESIVVLAHLLDVPITDVLSLKAKDSNAVGMRDDHDTLFYPHGPLSSEPTEIILYTASAHFTSRNLRDISLYDLANRTLDDAIRSIPGFNLALARYKELQARAQVCSDIRANLRDWCYWSDQGCGYECLDTITTPSQYH